MAGRTSINGSLSTEDILVRRYYERALLQRIADSNAAYRMFTHPDEPIDFDPRKEYGAFCTIRVELVNTAMDAMRQWAKVVIPVEHHSDIEIVAKQSNKIPSQWNVGWVYKGLAE